MADCWGNRDAILKFAAILNDAHPVLAPRAPQGVALKSDWTMYIQNFKPNTERAIYIELLNVGGKLKVAL